MGYFDDLPDEVSASDEGTTTPAAGLFDDLPDEVPAKAASDYSWTDYAKSVAQKAAAGTTFNWADELGAGIGAGSNYIARKLGVDIPEKTYRGILDEMHGQEKQFEKAYPKTALGAEIAGALAPGTGGARFILNAPSWGTRAVRAGMVAAPYGSVSEVGKLEGDDKTAGDYGEAAGFGALRGAVAGAGLSAVGSGLGATVGPWASEQARRLMDRGIRLTPGEVVGGYAKRAEDTLTSIPFLSKLVRDRQAEGVADLNREGADTVLRGLNTGITTQRLLSPVTAAPRHLEPGHDLNEFVSDAVSAAYQQTIPNLRAHIDSGVRTSFAHIRGGLPQSIQAQFDDAIQRNVTASANRVGQMDGRSVQNALGGLRDEARSLITSQASSHYDRVLGRALNRARDVVRNNARVSSGTQAFRKFQNIDDAFARLVRVEKAATSVAAEGGVYTPAMLHRAVQSSDRSARKAGFARGNALMQDLSDDAKTAMTRKISDSGTPERAAMSGAIGGALYLEPSLAAGPLAASLLYTRAGNAAFRRLASFSPQTRAALRQAILAGSSAGGTGATELMDQMGY